MFRVSGNNRGYVWFDEVVEHSDQDSARAAALASKWSALHNAAESRMFSRMSDYEDGRNYGPDPCEECDACISGGVECVLILEFREQAQEREAERQLEIELVEDKLQRIGARMMRPYEHWNEDERLVEYMERDRD